MEPRAFEEGWIPGRVSLVQEGARLSDQPEVFLSLSIFPHTMNCVSAQFISACSSRKEPWIDNLSGNCSSSIWTDFRCRIRRAKSRRKILISCVVIMGPVLPLLLPRRAWSVGVNVPDASGIICNPGHKMRVLDDRACPVDLSPRTSRRQDPSNRAEIDDDFSFGIFPPVFWEHSARLPEGFFRWIAR